MKLCDLSVIEAVEKYKSGEFTATQMVNDCIDTAKENENKNAIIEIFDDALEFAKALDNKRASGEKLGKLAGVVITIKDNILYRGKKATAGSNFMKNFVATYTSTALQKMIDEDAIVLGRTNMDEFACGSDGESSIYGASINALCDGKIAGGSSGGSAVAVALKIGAVSLGSDAGGSARKPAIFNGVCAIKPTYGTVSRHGLYTFSASFDQVSPIARNVKDLAYVLSIISGNDAFDMTTVTEKALDFNSEIGGDIKGVTFGVEKNILEKCKSSNVYPEFIKLLDFIEENGGIVKEIEIENVLSIKDVYDVVSSSEIASGFGRFDGLKYTTQADDVKNIGELYKKSRAEGFGREVKRRIMVGNHVLTTKGAYQNAKNVSQLIMDSINKAFESVAIMLLPTSLDVAPSKGEQYNSEIESTLNVIANVTKLPAVAIPFATNEEKMPFGVSVFACKNEDAKALAVANFIQENYKGGNK